MKKIMALPLAVLMSFQCAFAQRDAQILYFDANDRRVQTRDSAYYFRTIESSFSRIDIQEFYLNGNLKQTVPALSVATGNSNGLNETWYENGNKKSRFNTIEGKPEGEFTEWYENGQLKLRLHYKRGLFDGEASSWYPTGQKKRESVFSKGKDAGSQCYKEDGEPAACTGIFMKTTTFGDGPHDLNLYLARNLRYPAKARRQGRTGNVFIGFLVDKQGIVRDAHVMRRVSDELDAEALRVVRMMPAWEPGIMDGEFAITWYVLPVSFRMK